MEVDKALKSIPRGNVPETEYNFGLNLIKQYLGDKITTEEFEKELAYLGLNCGFNNMKPLPLPQRPQELFEFDSLNDYQKKKIKEEFWRTEPIFSYNAKKHKVLGINRSNKAWLKVLLNRFESYGDRKSAGKVRVKIEAHTQS